MIEQEGRGKSEKEEEKKEEQRNEKQGKEDEGWQKERGRIYFSSPFSSSFPFVIPYPLTYFHHLLHIFTSPPFSSPCH